MPCNRAFSDRSNTNKGNGSQYAEFQESLQDNLLFELEKEDRQRASSNSWCVQSDGMHNNIT